MTSRPYFQRRHYEVMAKNCAEAPTLMTDVIEVAERAKTQMADANPRACKPLPSMAWHGAGLQSRCARYIIINNCSLNLPASKQCGHSFLEHLMYSFERYGFLSIARGAQANEACTGHQVIVINWVRLPNKNLLRAHPKPHLICIVDTKSNRWIANNIETHKSIEGVASTTKKAKHESLNNLLKIA